MTNRNRNNRRKIGIIEKRNKIMTNEEALKVMCERCSNHEMCQGTGCEPKNLLSKAIEELDATNKIIEEWAQMVDDIEENERRIEDNARIRKENANL